MLGLYTPKCTWGRRPLEHNKDMCCACVQTDTRGTATVNRVFDSYGPYIRGMERKPRAAMVSMAAGQITAYALDSLQSRGRLFVAPGTARGWTGCTPSRHHAVTSMLPSFRVHGRDGGTSPCGVFMTRAAGVGWVLPSPSE